MNEWLERGREVEKERGREGRSDLFAYLSLLLYLVQRFLYTRDKKDYNNQYMMDSQCDFLSSEKISFDVVQ